MLEPSNQPNPALSPDSEVGSRPIYLSAPVTCPLHPVGALSPKPTSKETLPAWGHPEPTLPRKGYPPFPICQPFLA